MAAKKRLNIIYDEQLFEIRFEPDPLLLDSRGLWVEEISKSLDLDKWQISSNRIDVHDEKKSLRTFISFNNLGLIVRSSPSKYYLDNTNKYLDLIGNNYNFLEHRKILRIGTRFLFWIEFKGNINKLVKRCTDRYVNITPEARKCYGNNKSLLDLGFSSIFKSDKGSIRTKLGPMTVEEAPNLFSEYEYNRAHNHGLFYDIEYYSLPDIPFDSSTLKDTIIEFSNESLEIYDNIAKLIFS
ncbi:MAG: hypothetical protein P9L92_17455 [Candidatus Electryonea clarkiae]|nr:hypothetical protein [Candidatus Electryonea clarkiae]